jgi:protein disulfide-isomerase
MRNAELPREIADGDPAIFRKEDNMFRFHWTSVNYSSAYLLSFVLMVASSAVCAAEPSGKNWHHDWDSAWDASQAEGRPILIFVTKKCCFYCDKMRNDTYGNSSVLDDIDRDFVPLTIDSDRYPDIVSKYNVRLFPTTVIIGSDAEVIGTKAGYMGPEQMRSWLKAYGARVAKR